MTLWRPPRQEACFTGSSNGQHYTLFTAGDLYIIPVFLWGEMLVKTIRCFGYGNVATPVMAYAIYERFRPKSGDWPPSDTNSSQWRRVSTVAQRPGPSHVLVSASSAYADFDKEVPLLPGRQYGLAFSASEDVYLAEADVLVTPLACPAPATYSEMPKNTVASMDLPGVPVTRCPAFALLSRQGAQVIYGSQGAPDG